MKTVKLDITYQNANVIIPVHQWVALLTELAKAGFYLWDSCQETTQKDTSGNVQNFVVKDATCQTNAR